MTIPVCCVHLWPFAVAATVIIHLPSGESGLTWAWKRTDMRPSHRWEKIRVKSLSMGRIVSERSSRYLTRIIPIIAFSINVEWQCIICQTAGYSDLSEEWGTLAEGKSASLGVQYLTSEKTFPSITGLFWFLHDSDWRELKHVCGEIGRHVSTAYNFHAREDLWSTRAGAIAA